MRSSHWLSGSTTRRLVPVVAAAVILAAVPTALPAAASGGAVATLAGSSPVGFADGPALSAKFSGATGGLALSGTAVFVADAGNHRIRRLDGGLVTTVAGDGIPGTTDGAAATTGTKASPTIG